MTEENKICKHCNAIINENTQFCPQCGKAVISTIENNSGEGPDSVVLDIVSKKFNWGAFFLTWIWGLFNKSYLTLLMLPAQFLSWVIFPFGYLITFGLAIWFGIEGNKWAWQNKRFESIEQFHKYQKNFAIAGTIIAIVTWILIALLFLLIILVIGAAAISEKATNP